MATKKLKGLGRGLDALLGGDAHDTPGDPRRAVDLPVTQLQAGKYQPRTRMDDGSLSELAASIKSQGIMQPVLVRPIGQSRAKSATRSSPANAASARPSWPAWKRSRCWCARSTTRTPPRWP
jgi:ParB family chromosome partitioning protein